MIPLFMTFGLRIWYYTCGTGLALTVGMLVLGARRTRRDGESLR